MATSQEIQRVRKNGKIRTLDNVLFTKNQIWQDLFNRSTELDQPTCASVIKDDPGRGKVFFPFCDDQGHGRYVNSFDKNKNRIIEKKSGDLGFANNDETEYERYVFARFREGSSYRFVGVFACNRALSSGDTRVWVMIDDELDLTQF